MHVYSNYVEALQKQLKRIPNPFPILKISNNHQNIEDYKLDDFEFIGYNPLGKIKM